MSGDYKCEIQEIAEEIADRQHNKRFYDLDEELQAAIYDTAVKQYWDSKA